MPKLRAGQEVDVRHKTMDNKGYEGRGTLIKYKRTEFKKCIGGRFDGERLEFEFWTVKMDNGKIKTRGFIVQGLKPQLTSRDVQKLIHEQGLTLPAVIDEIIKINDFTRNELLCLGDYLKDYCYKTAKKQ